MLDGRIQPSTNAISSIQKLPFELIVRIIDFVHPATHLNFACACKRLAECSADILKRHQDAHTKYHVVSDLLPSTVPDLIRLVASDSIEAWHVRSFEVWGARYQWNEWYPFDLANDHRKCVASTAPPLELIESDIETFYQLGLENGCIPENNRFLPLKGLWEGNDGILKGLLFSLLPRLRSIKYVWRMAYYTPYPNRDVSPMDPSLEALMHLIDRSYEENTWAPGLRSLEEVAVGVKSKCWMGRAGCLYKCELLPTLLKLPSIKSLYLNKLYHLGADDGYEHRPQTYGLKKSFSTLEHLFIEAPHDWPEDSRDAVLSAPKALKTFAISGRLGTNFQTRCQDVDLLVDRLREHQHETLESLVMYQTSGLQGSSNFLYSPRDASLSTFKALRHVFVDYSDLITGKLHVKDDRFDEEPFPIKQHWDNNLEAYIEAIKSVFPETMEVLMIGQGDNRWYRTNTKLVEKLLSTLIEERWYPKLQSIFIQKPYGTIDMMGGDFAYDLEESLAFKELITVAKRHGVNVSVWGCGHGPQHYFDLPCVPNLETCPFAESRRSGDWCTNPFNGYSQKIWKDSTR